jgi:Ca-activated chloride channel homolog
MSKRSKNRTGAALILVITVLGVVLIITAYSAHVAYMQLVRSELRASADAAARAGAEALARLESVDAAKQAAIDIAAANKVGGSTLQLTVDDIQIGHAKQVGNSGKWSFFENEKPYSSVRVNAQKNTALMMFGLTGKQSFTPELISTAAFSENEICLVIDRSHSMCFDFTGVDFSYPAGIPLSPNDPVIYAPHPSGSRWAALASGVNTFLSVIKTSNATQRVALVTWGSDISLATYEGGLTGRTFPASSFDLPLAVDTAPIVSAIAARGSDLMLGGTNMSAGIDMGVGVLTGADTHDFASKIMIVMTDGKWNFGRDPVQAAADAKKKNITIHTVTFLDKADQTAMKMVAKKTGGNHYHASNQTELQTAFREMAASLPVVLIDKALFAECVKHFELKRSEANLQKS